MTPIFQKIVAGLLTPLFFLAHWSGALPEQSLTPVPEQAFGSYNITGGGTYRLKNSVGLSNSTINLSSFKEPVSNIAYTMSYINTSIAYGTLDPQTTRSEFISFTGITQNSDGSAQLTGVTRGLTRTPAGSSCTASTTLAQAHPGQSAFILSDSPCHFANYAVKSNDETITGQWTFNSFPITPSNSAASETVAGVVELGTREETASSTLSGGVGRLAISTRVATDTPSTYSTSSVVVTNPTGKINSGFLDLTTYNSAAIFSSTTVATTTSSFFTNLQKVFATTTTTSNNTEAETVMWATNLPPDLLTGAALRIYSYADSSGVQATGCSDALTFARLYIGNQVVASTTFDRTDPGVFEFLYTIVNNAGTTKVGLKMATTTGDTAGMTRAISSFNYVGTTTASYTNITTSNKLNLKWTLSVKDDAGGTCFYRNDYTYAEIIR